MRIDDNQASAIGAAAAGASKQVKAAAQRGADAPRPESGAASGDEVRLSSVADRVSADGQASPERMARVAELGRRVQSGQYHPDPLKVADGIIGDMIGEPAESK